MNAPPSSDHPQTSATHAGEWRFIRQLSGGLSDVQLAESPAGRAVVKIARTPQAQAQLRREARVGDRVVSARVAAPIEARLDESPPYLVLPYFEGGSLREMLDTDAKLPADQAAEVLADILAGLSAIHAAGWVHGDLKPDNILFDTDGRAAVADLGLAQPVGTGDGRAPGTWNYMSPQRRGGSPAACGDDVWSAGVLLFEMLVGRLPLGLIDDAERRDLPSWAAAVFESACSSVELRPTDAGALWELLSSHYNLGNRAYAPSVAVAVDESVGQDSRSIETFAASGTLRPMALSPGLSVDEFELVEPTGRSKFVEMWKARRHIDSAEFTLKFFGDPQFLKNLSRDRRPIAELRHKHLAALYERRLDRPHPYAVSEFVEGETLRERIQRGPMPAETACRLASQMLGALSAAHAAGIAHRNVKPENVLLDSAGDVHLADLGLGAAVEETACQMTMSGMDWTEFGPLWRYLAPEQQEGETGGPAGDVYAVGLILYEMIHGVLPPPVLRRQAITELPPRLRPLLARALAPLPTRYADAAEFLRALEDLKP